LAVIEVPNKFIASWLRENYVDQIRDCFKNNLDLFPKILFTYKEPSPSQDISKHKPTQKLVVSLHHDLNRSWTFANFIKANSNQFAYSSALTVSNSPGEEYNPLYIFGKPGVGKSHLLNAIGNRILANNPLAKVRYFSADRFAVEFSLAKKKHALHDFKESCNTLDSLIIDDIHLLAVRETAQEELSSLINLFYQCKKQIVVAAKTPPSQIRNLNPQLRSRLEWGLLSEIQAPDQNTKIKIIKKKAKEENLYLPDDVVFFLANATNDIQVLIQYLVSLETQASLHRREIDMSTVKSMIKSKRGHAVSVRDIQKLIAGHFNISLSDLLSNKKTRSCSYPRQLAMYLSRKLTQMSFNEIGKAFGNKDHSTVIYAVKRIEKEKNQKRDVLNDINKLNSFLA
jgi:chromosomal replication initiator protein